MRMEGSDHELVRRARDGEDEAFRELLERHARNVFKTAFRVTRNEQSAEDVVQETFLRVHRQLHRFDRRARFGTWLYRIAMNCAIDLMRKEKRRDARAPMQDESLLDGLASSAPGPERVTRSHEIGTAVEHVLETLSPAERTAFVLRHHEGRSIAEIGEILGVRTNACKSTIFRAVQKLRAALEPILKEGHETAAH